MILTDLNLIRGDWYLATPYSKFPRGLDAAYAEACVLAARLMRAGVSIFSPIAHSHGVAHHGAIDKLDHEFWKRANKFQLEHAAGLLIGTLISWDESAGIAHEIHEFRKARKPILYIDPETLDISDET